MRRLARHFIAANQLSVLGSHPLDRGSWSSLDPLFRTTAQACELSSVADQEIWINQLIRPFLRLIHVFPLSRAFTDNSPLLLTHFRHAALNKYPGFWPVISALSSELFLFLFFFLLFPLIFYISLPRILYTISWFGFCFFGGSIILYIFEFHV